MESEVNDTEAEMRLLYFLYISCGFSMYTIGGFLQCSEPQQRPPHVFISHLLIIQNVVIGNVNK